MGGSVSSIGGMFGFGGGGAAGDASKAMMKGIKKGVEFQKDQLGKVETEFNPYLTAGSGATNLQANLLGLNGVAAEQQAFNNYMMSPGQQWLRDQGEKTLLRNSAAIGGLGGGNVRRGLEEYGIGFAAQDYGNYYNRLAGLGSQGANMTSNLGGLRQGFGANVSNLYTMGGQAQASGIMGAANQKQAGFGNLLGGIGALGSVFAPGFSDIRLKSNIEKIGELPNGLNVYEYDIFDRHEVGVIAQEVLEIIPEAVFTHPSGYLMVDYSKVQ